MAITGEPQDCRDDERRPVGTALAGMVAIEAHFTRPMSFRMTEVASISLASWAEKASPAR